MQCVTKQGNLGCARAEPLSHLFQCAAALALTVTIMVLPAVLHGQSVPAIKFSPPTFYSGFNTFTTCGYSFNVNSPAGVSITHLSMFDAGSNGLALAHAVGLWNSAGTLLASATVPIGTSAALDASGQFRFVDIPDITLPQGTGYAVGGLMIPGSDGSASEWTNLIVAPGITYGQPRFLDNNISTPTFPSSVGFGTSGYVGGSFLVAPIPEPMNVAMAAIVAVPMLCRRSRVG